MKYNIRSLLCLLVTLGFLFSCAQGPQQATENTLVPPTDIATKKAKDAAVHLVNRFGDSVRFSSGFFVDKDKIATNIHVIAQPGPIFAKLNDQEITSKIVGVVAYDVKNNLVILKIAGKGKPLSISDSDTVQIGETVSIVGYLDGKYKTTTGTIDTIQKSDKWFGIKGTISKESSGGPVLNSKGQVIGIIVGYGDDSENYAIPSNALKVLLTQSVKLKPLVEWRKREAVRAEVYHSQGEKYSTDEEYKNAIVDFDKAISLNPEHVRAYYKRARAKFYLNDYTGAIDDCTHAIKLNPEHAKAYRGRGAAKSILGESKSDDGNVEKAQHLYQEAIEDFNQVIKIDPEDATTFRNRGISKCKLGDIESTQGNVENAQRLYDEGIVDVGKSIQLKYMQDINTPIALLESKKYIAASVSVICWTGRLSFGSGFFVDTDKIATNIHVVARHGPVFVKLLNNDSIWEVEEVSAFDIKNDLVVLKISGEGTPLTLGNSDKVQSGEPVVAVGYPDGKYKVTTGNIYNIQNSDNWLGTTAEISDGNSGGPLLNSKREVIGINTRAGKYSFAVPSNILKPLITFSGSPEPLTRWQRRNHIRAFVFQGEGEDKFNDQEYTKAIMNFDNAILHNPNYFRAYNWRGHANFHLGQSKAEKGNVEEAQHLYEVAINDFSISIKIDPKYTFPYFHRGLARLFLGQSKANQGNIVEAQQLFQAAIEDYTQAVKIDPEHTNAYSNRGSTKHELGISKADQGNTTEAQQLYKEAIEDYTHALKLNPEDVDTYYNLGIVKIALGQTDEAEKVFARAKELESKK
ncbi:tetratricopeptide repeat protein [Candidatus Poribacteria bacterium]|nr:tetratricopeptide repeat protein [Candidatus Poribacteria bacterium]